MFGKRIQKCIVFERFLTYSHVQHQIMFIFVTFLTVWVDAYAFYFILFHSTVFYLPLPPYPPLPRPPEGASLISFSDQLRPFVRKAEIPGARVTFLATQCKHVHFRNVSDALGRCLCTCAASSSSSSSSSSPSSSSRRRLSDQHL